MDEHEIGVERERDGQRLQALRRRLRVTLAEMGEVFGCSANVVYKMEVGLCPCGGLRRLVLEALERALFTASPEQVWGPRVYIPARNPAALPRARPISPAQRVARILGHAYPEAGAIACR